jgi:hypothetical protein
MWKLVAAFYLVEKRIFEALEHVPLSQLDFALAFLAIAKL